MYQKTAWAPDTGHWLRYRHCIHGNLYANIYDSHNEGLWDVVLGKGMGHKTAFFSPDCASVRISVYAYEKSTKK